MWVGPRRPVRWTEKPSTKTLPLFLSPSPSASAFQRSTADLFSIASAALTDNMSFRSYSMQTSAMPSGNITINRSGYTPTHRAASTYGGAGGYGTRISSASYSGVRSSAAPGASFSSFQMSGGGGGAAGLGAGAGAAGMGLSAGGGGGAILGNEKGAMQNLNDRLASYLETVRSLEQANMKLEVQIREAMEKGGPDAHDHDRYRDVLEDLRKQVFDKTVENSRLVLQIDNARLAADDFRVKFESELTIRKSVEADIAGLRKVIDDTNMGRLNLESEVEAVTEELTFLRKNHDNEVQELRNQIAQSGVQVDVDAPKGQDMSQVMEDMRANYEKMATKNAEELKAWHESQISVVQVQVSQNTEALQGARTEHGDLQRQVQTLEIELISQKNLKSSLDDTLRDIEMRNNMEMEKYNNILLQVEAELTNLRNNIQHQTQEYEALLNIKVKLEAEIATYRSLLDGGDFRLQDALSMKDGK
ncbi:keratin, type I cytoskeletal 18-like [Conger conger]|uniref:keratin, type I cytoskeletal 18-like n=1 Tax=Conger conger TaxID=82655 RepID=UPI002A5B04AE|nr:keratin, type I cytoskeletal 18-like [Conger conger]